MLLAGGGMLTVFGKDGVAGVIVTGGWLGAAGAVVSGICGKVAGVCLAGSVVLLPVSGAGFSLGSGGGDSAGFAGVCC